MQTSRYLAMLIGPVLVIAGLGMLVAPADYLAMANQFLRSPALIYVGALLGLLGGVALVLAHNVWAADWRLIITLLGWVSIVDSASWLLLPRQMLRFATALMTPALPVAAGLVTALLGAVLCYFGYRLTGRIGRRS